MPATATRTCPRNLQLTTRLNIEAAEGDPKGPPKFKLVANTGEPMDLEGFFDPVIIDLAGAAFDKDSTPVIADHDTTQRIGHTTKQTINGNGIYAEGVVSSGTGIAQGFVDDAKAGFPFQVSVGAKIGKAFFVQEGQTTKVNGKEWPGPLIVSKQTLIRELSVTVLGADSKTQALMASATTNPSVERIETMTTTNTQDPAVQVERQRINAINGMLQSPSGGWDMSIQAAVEQLRASAINGDVALADIPSRVRDFADLQARRTAYPTGEHGPAIHAGNRPVDNTVLEAAIAKHAGLNIGKHYDERTAEASSRVPITCLLDACRLAVQATGLNNIDFRNKDTVIRAAFSTADIGTLLSNVANKSMLEAYRAFPSAARLIAKPLDANDFKVHTGIRLTGDTIFKEVASDGELKHGRLDDQSYTFKLATFARMFGLDRATLINDDTSSLDEIPRMLGRGGALAVEEVFWALVIANSNAFFHANNKNLLTGAGSALGGDSLADAVKLFLEQTDTEGKPIGVVPRWLAVPPALKAKGDELYTSRTFNVGAASATDSDRVTAANAFFGLYEPVASPWIGANGLAGGSDTAFYLFGDSRDVASFGIAYLDGNDKPTIEQQDQPFNKLGIQWRGFIDAGVCQIDHRGGVKSAGQ